MGIKKKHTNEYKAKVALVAQKHVPHGTCAPKGHWAALREDRVNHCLPSDVIRDKLRIWGAPDSDWAMEEKNDRGFAASF